MENDTISRQAAIDLWDKYHHTIAVDAMYYDAELRQLPSAPPTQLTDDDIETIRVHLSAIKENLCNQHRWNEAKEYEALIDRLTAQLEPCEDAVSRKAAIAQMQGLPKWNGIIADSCVDFEDVISVLENKENLPPVTPKQRTGKWEVITRHEHYPSGKEYEVDRCPFRHRTDHNGDGEFCGYCGAKMEGDAE